MQLIASGPASAFERFHFAGHWDPDGTAMIAAIRAAAKAPRLPVRKLPWSLLMLASPFVPFLREMREMRYLWQEPLRLDNTALIARLGEEPHTPLVDAVTETLISLGCLDAARGQSRAA
jgi:nucleoside-diphosphate-sugar epimerase